MRLSVSLVAGLLAAAAIVVIGVKVRDALHAPAPRPVVHDRTTVLQTPVLTPLPRDSGPRNNQRPRTLEPPGAKTGEPVPSIKRGPQNRPVTVRRRKTARTRPDRRRTTQRRPQPPAQTGQNQPPPSQPSKPPVCLTAPVPLAVTTPVAGVNC